ncbi:YceD family protein [Fontisphaera persica]|uniref:YceD family protein n=1 Tax=Fontisphaera persica TaxID=2974023 RepID=UPI0024BFFE44|nr:YceD family protein [Fontisphaera persica]WCJ58108.1 YceD family protein [Fontisphaera persica]
MSVQFSLSQLEIRNLTLQGELAVEDLDLDTGDAMLQVRQPLRYDIQLEKVEAGVYAHGRLMLHLNCCCVRCLKEFVLPLELAQWSRLLPLTGEDAVPVEKDIVDLTPILREDMLLVFPQHPLCEPGCGGLPQWQQMQASQQAASGVNSPWSVLDQLKLKS